MKKKTESESNEKKPYEKPKLKNWGLIKDLSQTASQGGKNDGGSFPANRVYHHCLTLPPEIDEHRILLTDEVCQKAYRDEILSAVQPGDVVLDLGCGTGIHSYFAIEAGASRVFAIEASSLIESARRAAIKNQMGDKIIFLQGSSEQLELPERVDVIISNLGFLNTLVSLPDAAKRFLKPGGRILPSQIQLELGLASLPKTHQFHVGFWKDRHYGYDFSEFLDWTNHPFYEKQEIQTLLGETQSLTPIEPGAEMPDHFIWESKHLVQTAGALHGISGWYHFFSGAKRFLSTEPPLMLNDRLWSEFFLPLQNPIEARVGDEIDIRLELVLKNEPIWRWKLKKDGTVLADHSNLKF